VSQSDIII